MAEIWNEVHQYISYWYYEMETNRDLQISKSEYSALIKWLCIYSIY
jgi:hypothetical protein